MPRLMTILSLAAVLAASQQSAVFAGEATLPARKAGIWELQTSMDEGLGPRDHTIKLCISAEMEANTVLASIAEHKQKCSRYEITSADGKTTVNSECLFNERTVVSQTEMTGDFQNAFAIKIASTTSDEKPGTKQTIVVKRTILQNGKYLGGDCGDLKPGEAMAADGTKVLVQ